MKGKKLEEIKTHKATQTDREKENFLTNDTLVDILCTRAALVPRGAITIELAIDGVRVTLSSHLTRVTGAGIINVAKQTLRI